MSEQEIHSATGMNTRVFVPLLIALLVLLVQTLYQTVQIRQDQAALDTSFAKQQEPLEQAQKMRTQLEGIAGDTAALADQGNPNAIRLRDYLQKQGVSIHPRQE